MRCTSLYLFVLVWITLVSTSFAVKPLTVGQLSAIVHIHGVAQSPQRVYLPQITDMQSAVYPYSPNRDGYGNAYISVKGNFDISIKVNVNSSHLLLVGDDPVTSSYGQDMQDYLKSTPLINSDDALIRAVANSIVKSDKTRLEQISDLVMWVNTHIKYDDKYSKVYLSGVETLKTGKGVCDEYTNLYASLARSLGIPTRIVVGLVYSGSSWQLHAWAESYVAGVWVPVDPTFAEIGQIDATHIVLYRGPTYPFYVSPNNVLVYSVDNSNFTNFTTDISTNVTYNNKPYSRQLFNVTLTVTNNGNTIVIPTYMLQTTEGFQLATPRRQYLILHPHESGKIIWTLVAPYGERSEYYIGIVGPKLDTLLPVHVIKKNPQILKRFKLGDIYAYSEAGNITVVVEVANTGNLDIGNLKLECTLVGKGSEVKYVSLSVGAHKRVKFEFPSFVGQHQIYVKAQYGNQTESGYTSVILAGHHGGGNPLEAFLVYLSNNSLRLFVLALGVLAFLVFLVLLSVHPPRKEPFNEREKWRKLLKMDKLK